MSGAVARSADGDIVRLALHGDEIAARAALARLEAAENRGDTWQERAHTVKAQRDALAEALRLIAEEADANRVWSVRELARAALAELENA